MHRLKWMIPGALLLAFGGVTAGVEPLRSGLQPGESIKSIFEPLNVTGEHAGEPHCLVCENGLAPVAMVFAREPSEALMKLIGKLDAAIEEVRKQQEAEVWTEKQIHGEVFLAEQALRTAQQSLNSARILAEKKNAKEAQVKASEDQLAAAQKQLDLALPKLKELRTSKKKALYNDRFASFVVFLNDKPDLDQELQGAAKSIGLKHVVLSIDNPAGPDGFKVVNESEVTVVLYREHFVKANYAFRFGELNDQASEKVLADLSKILVTN